MTEVKHMKWWGWGVEGVAFHHDDKPAFAPFVKKAVGLDVKRKPVPVQPFEQLDVPASRLDAAFEGKLAALVGAEWVRTSPMERVVHTFGKSLRDLIKVRAGLIERTPDVVVYPASEHEVAGVVQAAIAADAVLIPFGGGSNIAGSLDPQVAEERVVISLDLGRMASVLDLDEESGLARVQAGVQGPDLEAQLQQRGYTIGHFPDSFTHSTLGGWAATRSSGMQSDKYGDIADIVRGIRMVRPEGTVVIRPIPSASTGPSLREMIVGSEGRLGVITELTVQVHPKPQERVIMAYLFPSWKAGVEAMHAIARSDAHPTITRVSDPRETGFSFATQKKSRSVKAKVTKALLKSLEARGWELCLSFIGFEGSPEHVKYEQAIVKKIVKEHGGMVAGTGPGTLYDQKKFDTPYLRDFLLDRGASADVSETAAPWSKLQDVYASVRTAADAAYASLGRSGWIMCHLSHSYHAGACLYFTFAFTQGDEPLAEYDVVKQAIQQAFIDAGGTLSHHHGVGQEHAPWMVQDVSAEGVALMRGLFTVADPGNNFNPGKVLAD